MYRRWVTIRLCLLILLSFLLGTLHCTNSICTSSLTASLHLPCLVGPCLHPLQQIDHPGTQLVYQQLQARPDCFCVA
ncbi:hypothetical protein B0H14DRAFT_2693832 [Mycena olivaceomarginata]|nr:hypothetical protein B0H14DRAFT_2693832 [Mycena olivaceomarginata]